MARTTRTRAVGLPRWVLVPAALGAAIERVPEDAEVAIG